MRADRVASGVVLWAMLAIAIDVGLARLGYGLVLPGIRESIAGTYAAFGLVGTVHFAGYLCGSLGSPFFLRRDATARNTVVWSHVVVAATLLGSAFSGDLWVLGATRAIMGVGCGVGIAAVVTGALERVRPESRTAVSGIIWAGIAVGVLISAPSTPWILQGADRWRWGTIAVALLTIVTALGLHASFGAPVVDFSAAAGRETPFRLRDLLDPYRYRWLTLSYFCFGVGYTSYATFIISTLRARHTSIWEVTAVWTVLGIAALVGGLGIARLGAGRWKRHALTMTQTAGTLGALIASLSSAIAAIAGAAAVGLGFASTPAVVSALARARSSASTGAAAFVAVTTIMSIGAVLGPVLAGVVADRAGAASIPILSFAIYATGAVFAWLDAACQRSTAEPARYVRSGSC